LAAREARGETERLDRRSTQVARIVPGQGGQAGYRLGGKLGRLSERAHDDEPSVHFEGFGQGEFSEDPPSMGACPKGISNLLEHARIGDSSTQQVFGSRSCVGGIFKEGAQEEVRACAGVRIFRQVIRPLR
jgi:hypothetical protein